MAPDERDESGNAPNDEEQQEDEPLESWEILAEAVGRLLNEPGIAKSIADLITATAKNKSQQPNLFKTSYGFGLLFGLLIFIGIGVLGWLKVIGAEATTGLLGALIGYWYGREKGGSSH